VSTSTYVDDRFLQNLAPSILRKYATQKLLICPPHIMLLRYLGKNYFLDFWLITCWFLFGSMLCGWLWKEPFLWCWDEDADLQMDRT